MTVTANGDLKFENDETFNIQLAFVSGPTVTIGASGTGTITVNSYPWSRIYIDGKDVGRTPLQALPFNAGVHTVELIFPTADNMRVNKRVEIRPGREARIVHRLPAEDSQ